MHMSKEDREVIAIVNNNYEIKAFADRLNAISARRKKKKGSKRWGK